MSVESGAGPRGESLMQGHESCLPLMKKKCPACAESIQVEALVCRFCGHRFTEEEQQRDIVDAGQRAAAFTRSLQAMILDAARGRCFGWGLALIIIGGLWQALLLVGIVIAFTK